MHSKYIPITPMKTLIQTIRELFFLKMMMLKIGTSRMYMAVIKPALPAEV